MGRRKEKVVDHHPNIFEQATRLGRNSFGDFIRSWIIFHTNSILALNVFFVYNICYTILVFCETLSNVIPKLYVIIEIIFISSLCMKTVLYSSTSLRFLQRDNNFFRNAENPGTTVALEWLRRFSPNYAPDHFFWLELYKVFCIKSLFRKNSHQIQEIVIFSKHFTYTVQRELG